MRSRASKGIAIVFMTAVVAMGAFASTASAIIEYYWDGLMAPGGASSYNHTLKNASTRTVSGQYTCVQSYRASNGEAAGPLGCDSGAGALITLNYPCVCTLLHAATIVGVLTNVRARIEF